MEQRKAAVFILLGQSNAVGHGISMKEEEQIHVPMKNVFGLHREQNQSFHNAALRWQGYTSCGMNLAEQQDETWSVANCLAREWQAHIDAGNAAGLPDLYIVHIAIGAQGVTEEYMWHPAREEKLIPGKLGEVDISLFPYCRHIFSLLDASFRELEKVKIGEMSGGMQRRVNIALALSTSPEILIMDEATAGLDASFRENLLCWKPA